MSISCGNAIELGKIIWERRRELGLSQGELARRAGLSPSFISRLEGGAYQFTSPGTLTAIAKALEMDPQILYDVALSKKNKIDYKTLPRSPEEVLREINALMCTQIPIRGSVPAGIPAVKRPLRAISPLQKMNYPLLGRIFMPCGSAETP